MDAPVSTPRKQRVGCIDIGTNSILLLIAELDDHGHFEIIHDAMNSPRIGEGLAFSHKISDVPLARACEVLSAYRKTCHWMHVQKIVAFATAAVREATNREFVLAELAKSIGQKIELISKQDEAALIFESVAFDTPPEKLIAVIDIGGGSTEISLGKPGMILEAESLPLGTVKLLDQFFKDTTPPWTQALAQARSLTHAILKNSHAAQLNSDRDDSRVFAEEVFGTAGSFTMLASMTLALKTYSREAVDGFVIRSDLVRQWIDTAIHRPLIELGNLPGSDAKRIDLFLPGLVIIEGLLTTLNIKSITVKDRGIRFGKLCRLARTAMPE